MNSLKVLVTWITQGSDFCHFFEFYRGIKKAVTSFA